MLSAPPAPGASPSAPAPAPSEPGRRERVTGILVRALAVYSAAVLTLVVTVVLVGSKDAVAHAIIVMGALLAVLWCLVGGLLMRRYRDAIRERVLRLPVRWEMRFVLFATLLALIEEGITTSLTNLIAPLYHVPMAEAHITASSNYLIVIGFSSVVLFVPEFVGWMVLLRRYDFSPKEVLLLYGLLGTAMEATLNPTALYAGFWFFVYGLMVYLPAYSLPTDRKVVPPSWYHYPLAGLFPFLLALPVAGMDSVLGHLLRVHLWG